MFGKNFVSLYFLPNKLLLVQLASNKKKVNKFATIDLPEGLIKNFKVTDAGAMASVLKGIWSKFNIGEKSVGIILPEFSTFIKFFKFPNLSFAELNEAVAWQAQEHLPTFSNMMMDWKIIKRLEKETQVLIVACSSEVLMGYITAAERAGLYPLVIENPSISLVRLGKDNEGGVGRLIVYKNFGEVLLIVAEGQRVVGTSITQGATDDEIVKTASRMVSHYKDTPLARLEFCGSEVTTDLVKKMEQTLKIRADKIAPKIQKLDERKTQELLVPLSIQMQDPEAPEDPYSLNLLPAELVEKYKRARLRVQIWSLVLTVTLLVSVNFLVSLGSYLFLNQQISDMKGKVSVGKSGVREKYLAQVKEINETTEKILAIKSISFSVQNILNGINSAKPAGVKVDRYKLDLDKGEILLSGTSVDRVSLISFKQNLESNSDFIFVEVPISSFEAETNLEFSLNFEYSPAKVKGEGRKNGAN